MFARLFGKKDAAKAPSTGGRLIYAIGDVHGRLDALEPLLRDIGADIVATRPAEKPMIVFVGDYVDRGADSKGVVDLVLKLAAEPTVEVRALKGNHEEALLRFLVEPDFGGAWVDYGGGTTLASYGVNPPAARTDPTAWIRTRDAFAAAISAEHMRFYETLELMVVQGDYAFVHAGVRPGVPLDRQEERDLLWIRQEFLQATGPHGKVIVHGHTPTEEAQITRHRMGIDTGCYATNVLTAVRLDDAGHRLIQVRADRRATV